MRIAAGLMAVVLLIFLECKDWEKDETPEEQEEETDSDDEGPDTQQEKAPKKRDIVLAFGSLAAFILLLYYVINHGPDTPNGWTMWNLTVQALAYTALLLLNLAPTNKK